MRYEFEITLHLPSGCLLNILPKIQEKHVNIIGSNQWGGCGGGSLLKSPYLYKSILREEPFEERKPTK